VEYVATCKYMYNTLHYCQLTGMIKEADAK